MLLFTKKYKSIYEVFETYMHSSNYEDIDFVFDVVNYFRRKSKDKKTPINIDELIAEIKHEPERIAFLQEKLHNVFANKQKVLLFTDAGLLNSVSFFKELRRRISRQLLPDQPSQENIQYVLNQIFYRPSDAKWVLQIPLDNWKELFDILSFNTFYEDTERKTTSKQILLAIMILSQRMGGLALQTDVHRMVPEYAQLNSPFIALDDELNQLARTLSKENKPYLYIQEHELDYKQLNILAAQCEDFVNKADANAEKYGVTFSVNQTLLLIRQQIKRIKRLYNYLFIEKEADKKFPFLPFADSDNTQVGEWVLAVGNPFNLNSTVTAGIISAKARNISERGSDKIESFIQTDAVVNMGNSGGALVNLNGDLIGINTAISSTTGVYMGYSFAVPSNIAKKVVEDLIEYGNVQRGVMGVRGQGLDSEVAKKLNIKETEGFYVDSVDDESGAGAAGLKKGDIIKQIDNVKIHKYSDLSGHIASKRPGDMLKVIYVREGKERTANITLKKNTTYVIQSLGLEVKNLSEADQKRFKTKSGVKVTAAGQFYEYNNINIVGKVLLSVNGKTIKDVDELKNIMSNLSSRNRNSLEFLNERGEKERFFF